MVKYLLIFALLFTITIEAGRERLSDLLGPNTGVLVVSEACAPCVEAIEIIEQLQSEDYDVIIVNKDGTIPERMLARLFRIKSTPTLVIREQNTVLKMVRGLQSEATYRELITCN